MTLRIHALMALGLIAFGLDGAARAAGESRVAKGGAEAIAAAGSSSRDVRKRAEDAVPLARMGAEERAIAEQAIARTTLYRRLPAASVACDAALIDFVLQKPEALVDVWRVLGISRLALDPTGPARWRLSDGYGTVGTVRLLHQERHDRGGLYVFHGRGAYEGSLAPRQLTGSCLVVVRHTTGPLPAGGRSRQTVHIDAFLDVDGLGLEIVTRTLQPLIVRSAATNLHEISLFMTQFAAAAARNPAAVARIAERMTRTDPADRRRLVVLASGRDAGTTPAASRTPSAEDVQAELAARWMPAEQLEAARR
jgi:hypothetical protein